MIFHLAQPADWEAAQADGEYRISTRGVSLEEQGFIHCSYADQVDRVAGFIFADVDDLLLLTVDPTGLDVRDEPGDPDSDECFPHIYGPIPVTSVVATAPYPTSGDSPHA